MDKCLKLEKEYQDKYDRLLKENYQIKHNFHKAKLEYVTKRLLNYREMVENLTRQIKICQENKECPCLLIKSHHQVNLKLKKNHYEARLVRTQEILKRLQHKFKQHKFKQQKVKQQKFKQQKFKQG